FGFWVNAVSGTILLAADATTKFANPVFLIKMACIALAVSTMVLIRRRLFDGRIDDGMRVPVYGRMLAVTSIGFWLSAITVRCVYAGDDQRCAARSSSAAHAVGDCRISHQSDHWHRLFFGESTGVHGQPRILAEDVIHRPGGHQRDSFLRHRVVPESGSSRSG